MSIWFQDDQGNWPQDMPSNVIGYAVLHPDLDDDQLHTKADAERLASTLDGALVVPVVDVEVVDPCAANARGAVQSAGELTDTAGLSPEALSQYWEDISAGVVPRDALASARDVEDIRDVPQPGRETDDSAGREFSDA